MRHCLLLWWTRKKRLHGIHGWCFLSVLQCWDLLNPPQPTLLMILWMLLKGLWFCYMIEQAALLKSMKRVKNCFQKKSRNLDNIPPTQAALVQHTKTTVLQGGYVWGQTLLKQAVIPSPSDYGWIRDDDLEWLPYWTSLPQVKDTCSELIKCSCKSACRGRCKCSKANLTCTWDWHVDRVGHAERAPPEYLFSWHGQQKFTVQKRPRSNKWSCWIWNKLDCSSPV